MKKFNLKSITAIVAVALASIGLVLGSLSKTEEQVEAKAVEPALFWYEVNLADNELGEQKNTSPLTKSQVLAMPSITSCNDASSEICLRGYEAEQNEGDQFTTPPTDDHRINKE